MDQRKCGCHCYFCYRPTPLTVCHSEARWSLQKSRSLLLSGAPPGPRLRGLPKFNSICVNTEFGLGGGESLSSLAHWGLDSVWPVKETRLGVIRRGVKSVSWGRVSAGGGTWGNVAIQYSPLYVPTGRCGHSYNSKQSCDKAATRFDFLSALCSHEY